MEIFQNKIKKVIVVLLITISLITVSIPSFAARNRRASRFFTNNKKTEVQTTEVIYTKDLKKGDKIQFIGTAWYVYKTKDKNNKNSAQFLSNNDIMEILEIDKNWLTISIISGTNLNNKYISYGSSGARYFQKIEILEEIPEKIPEKISEKIINDLSKVSVGTNSIIKRDSMINYALSYEGKNGSYMSRIIGFSGEWCAAFTSHCYNKYFNNVLDYNYSSCNGMISYAQRKGYYHTAESGYIPKAGDMIFYDWEPGYQGEEIGEADHVGLVTSCDGRTITVVEGNAGTGSTWSSRTVEVKTRTVGSNIIYGYLSLADATK